jgi:hypothetical protein
MKEKKNGGMITCKTMMISKATVLSILDRGFAGVYLIQKWCKRACVANLTPLISDTDIKHVLRNRIYGNYTCNISALTCKIGL